MELVRIILRGYLSIGRGLPVPWRDVLPALLLGATYLIAVRVLLPYVVRLGRAILIAIISVVSFMLLLPDLVSTSLRRSRGLQPAAWTFSVGDGISKTQDRWFDSLHQLKPKPKPHTRLAVVVIAAAVLLPVGAFYGTKTKTNPRLRADSAKVLDWYAHLDRWTRDK